MNDLYLYIQKSQKIRYMQKRHTDRKMYFRDLEITSKEFYISYLSDFTELTPKSRILEVGCGEGGNLVPFAQLGCKVTGIDIAECRIKEAKADQKLWFINPHYKQKFHLTPRLLPHWVWKVKYIRNFFTTSCWYILTISHK